MKDNFVPVLVEKDNKKELWRIDVSALSITELIKLKEELLLREPYKTTIQTIDAMIREDAETLICSNNSKNSYVRTHKKNKKKAKIEKEAKMKKAKIRRR